VRFHTDVGMVLLEETVLLPSWLEVLLPQHLAVPSLSTAHAKLRPTDTDATPEVRPCGVTGTEELVWELLPNSPLALLPQHFTSPLLSSAQACCWATLTADTPEVSPSTCTGTVLLAVLLLPSSPEEPRPQPVSYTHLTLPTN
jgi:hypothetical protein